MMRVIPTTATFRGKKIQVLEVRCPRCNGGSFHLHSLTPGGHPEPHTHMGCTRCGSWFCNANQGSTCGEASA